MPLGGTRQSIWNPQGSATYGRVMDSTPEETIRLLHYCLLIGGVILIYGIENRYPLTAIPAFRDRVGHAGANLGLWLFSLILVDLGLGAFLNQQPLLDHLANQGFLASLGLPSFWLILISLLILDLAGYTIHYLLHRLPWLWTFHSVHHSDPDLDISTSFRFHPGEALTGLLWLMVIIAVFGIPVWLIALRSLIILPLSLMHHANVTIPDPIERSLRLVLVTPGLHKIHHSPRQPETDSNYGLFLSVWDRLFGTLHPGPLAAGPRYGLSYLVDTKWQSVWGMLRTPWSGIFSSRNI